MSTTLMGKIRRFEAKQRKDTYFRVNLDASRIERMLVGRHAFDVHPGAERP